MMIIGLTRVKNKGVIYITGRPFLKGYKYYTPNENGIKKLAKYLIDKKIYIWYYSSSIDFPEESGLRLNNHKELLEKHYKRLLYKYKLSLPN